MTGTTTTTTTRLKVWGGTKEDKSRGRGRLISLNDLAQGTPCGIFNHSTRIEDVLSNDDDSYAS